MNGGKFNSVGCKLRRCNPAPLAKTISGGRPRVGVAKIPAAAGEYLWTNPTNAGMRRKFELPLDRPVNP